MGNKDIMDALKTHGLKQDAYEDFKNSIVTVSDDNTRLKWRYKNFNIGVVNDYSEAIVNYAIIENPNKDLEGLKLQLFLYVSTKH